MTPSACTRANVPQLCPFVVNIALIQKGKPILGVIHAPMLAETFWAESGKGAFKKLGSGAEEKIFNSSKRENFRVLASGSMMTDGLCNQVRHAALEREIRVIESSFRRSDCSKRKPQQ